MASEDVCGVLDTCARKINDTTAHPENFLSIQDDLAADFTSLTKTLYDLHKAREPTRCKGSPLAQLVVENFDEEQIWQELELQNAPVLNYFEKEIRAALSNDMLTLLVEEEDGEGDEEEMEDENLDGEEEETGSLDGEEDEDEEEERRQSSKKPSAVEDRSDEDSNFDFDVAALEKREKQKALAKGSKVKVVPSEVDDKFFKLSEMESFLDDMDKREGKDNQDIHDVDYFQDLPSDGDEELDLEMLLAKKQKKTTTKSSRNLKYKDYFDAVEGAAAAVRDGEDDSMEDDQDQEDEDQPHSEAEEDEEDEEEEDGIRAQTKKVTFDLSGDEDSEGEDLADIFGGKKQEAAQSEAKSAFEKRQEKMSERIEEMERAALAQKPWQLSGEVTAQTRPENSILEEDLDFERSARMAPAITEETTLQLEDIIKQRIKDQAFDDVVRKEKPKEEVFEYKKRLTLDHEKSKLSLAQVYEQEYLKQTQAKTEEEENPAHKEIQKLMDSLFLKLDALSNFHFTPKPSVPEVKVVSNLPSITMEEVAPVTASAATLLAPEEIKEKNKGGDLLGDSEKTATDKKRDRRHKKKVKHFKLKEKEKRNKLKAAGSKQPSKGEMAENLKKLSKAGKATILKDEGKDKALRSSQAFFSQLQEQVKSQIKSAKDQSSKTKKHKELSASKLKL